METKQRVPVFQILQPKLALLTIILEIVLIFGITLFFTKQLNNFSPALQYQGGDLSLVTQGTAFGAAIYQKTGSLPLWNPFVGGGEPQFESPQSFAFNPLMTLPLMWWGPVQGTKAAILFHIYLMGLGGWLLARVLGLHSPGRLALALLLAASGSYAAPLGRGLYQLGLTQTYVPWVYAGLIGVLYFPKRRWPIIALVVFTFLLVTGGTFWYALPTAIGAAVICAFALFDLLRPEKRSAVIWFTVRRLAIASALIIGLCAGRLITINRTNLFHPTSADPIVADLFTKFASYVTPITIATDSTDWWQNYHYVVPVILLVLVIALRLLLVRKSNPFAGGRWRILLPGILLLLFFTIWALGETPLYISIRNAIPFIADWRNTGRMAAAATPWLIIITAIWFDDVILLLRRLQQDSARQQSLRMGAGVAASILIFVFVLSVPGVFRNWTVYGILIPAGSLDDHFEAVGLNAIRQATPGKMITAINQVWVSHYGFVNTLIRHRNGDSDVFTTGVPPTIGESGPLAKDASPYAVGYTEAFIAWVKEQKFLPLVNSPMPNDVIVAWHHPDRPDYAFMVTEPDLVTTSWHPLTRAVTTDLTYFHAINNIELIVEDWPEQAIAVANETAYPGWQVSINGQPATLESVDSHLAVRLPARAQFEGPLSIVFTYRPFKLVAGMLLTALTAILTIALALRLDIRYWRRYRVPTSQLLHSVQAAVVPFVRKLNDPNISRKDDESDE